MDGIIRVLCEDKKHESFLRRFLAQMNVNLRKVYFDVSPAGRGAASSYVVKRFPDTLCALRRKTNHLKTWLIVLIDGDNVGFEARATALRAECTARGIEHPKPSDPLLILIPTWSIETWMLYLSNREWSEVETLKSRAQDLDMATCVASLAEACRRQSLPTTPPPSLIAACRDWNAKVTQR